jgi:hypothetical protein
MKFQIVAMMVAATAAGCASAPVPNAALENARSVVQSTESDPNVARYAPLELQAARDELAVADAAALHRDDAAIAQPAYLATQSARLAQLRAASKADDARVAAGQKEREQIQLAARALDVDAATAQSQEAAAKAAALQAELDALKQKRSQ